MLYNILIKAHYEKKFRIYHSSSAYALIYLYR